MSKIVRYSMDEIKKLGAAPESAERLKRLAALPDAKINTDDIPETTPEQWRTARMPGLEAARKTSPKSHGLKKAS
jgi:hypothetical protein